MQTSTKVALGVVAAIGLLAFWGVTTGNAYEEGYDDCKAGCRRGVPCRTTRGLGCGSKGMKGCR